MKKKDFLSTAHDFYCMDFFFTFHLFNGLSKNS
jgi:hypothetical protein